MKILILLKTWEGGVGVCIKNISKELEKQGHKVDIISREDDMKMYSFMKSIFPLRKIVKHVMKNTNYDIVYTQDWSMALPLMFPYHIFKDKHYCCFHGIQPGITGLFQDIVGDIMKEKIIVIGDSLKQQFPKSNLIFNGVDLTKFKSIENVKKIKDSVGFANKQTDIYNFNKIKKAVEETGKEFIAVWNVSSEKMPEFYNKIETFISLPPLYTSCALVWLEAVACGVPKIIGNTTGMRFPINYIEDFNSIKDALLNAEEKNTKSFSFEKFTWNYHTNKLIELWKK